MWREWEGSVWGYVGVCGGGGGGHWEHCGTAVDSNKIYLMLVSSQLISAKRHERTNGQRLTDHQTDRTTSDDTHGLGRRSDMRDDTQGTGRTSDMSGDTHGLGRRGDMRDDTHGTGEEG